MALYKFAFNLTLTRQTLSTEAPAWAQCARAHC